jgi:hypothetical protein
MFTSLASTTWKGIALTLVVAVSLGTASVASAETVTTEEPVVLENGETALEVTQVTDEAETTLAGKIRCKKVYGWHGLKHPLFGYFYWKYILTIRWCWQAGGSVIVKTTNPWSPTYWRDVECCLQFSGWDFKGHIGLNIDGGANKSLYPRPHAGQVPAVLPVLQRACIQTRSDAYRRARESRRPGDDGGVPGAGHRRPRLIPARSRQRAYSHPGFNRMHSSGKT